MTGAILRPGQAELPTTGSTHSYWHKEPSEALLGHRTTEQLPATTDVVVIGSGITGAFAARELVAGGKGVVMIEAREACWGATGRNGGHCQPLVHLKEPSVARFELDTFHFLDDLITTNKIACDWRVVGSVHALTSTKEAEVITAALETLRREHPDLADHAVLYKDRASLAGLRIPDVVGAVYLPNAARCWPYKLVCWVIEELLRQNSVEKFNLQTKTPVVHLQRAGNSWIVHTSRGQIAAKDVLLATNGYTSHLLPKMTGLITPVRGQVAALRAPSGYQPLDHSYGWVVGDSDDYLIQRDGSGDLIFGGERQSAIGGEVGVSRDDTINQNVAKDLRQNLTKTVKLRPPACEEEDELAASYEWTGIMGYSRDHNPWVGRVPPGLGVEGTEKGGLWVSAGYTGHGMPVAARCGVAVAEMILGKKGGVELAKGFEASDERAERARQAKMQHKNAPDASLLHVKT